MVVSHRNKRLRARARSPAKDPLKIHASLELIASKANPPFELTPYPDALLDELEAPLGNPGAEYDLQESVQLAFLGAVQLLPPRQRASGRLRRLTSVPTNEMADSFVQRCVAAWQAADVGQLADLLKAEVVMGAPSLGIRLSGRPAVSEFLASVPAFQERANFRFVATRANRQPAVAYRHDENRQSGTYAALAIVVFTIDGDSAASIHVFPDPGSKLMPVFGLPSQI